MSRHRSKEHSASKHPWSVPVAVAEVPEIGRQLEISADANVRAAIAKIAKVVAVQQLTATFDLTRHGHDGIRILGKVAATIEQQCVLTLEPIENKIEEAIDLVYMPQGVAQTVDEPSGEGEPPEILHDGMVDLGAVATEFLLLGIDPYPRKPDAVFTAPAEKDVEANRPFAALATLKKDLRGS